MKRRVRASPRHSRWCATSKTTMATSINDSAGTSIAEPWNSYTTQGPSWTWTNTETTEARLARFGVNSRRAGRIGLDAGSDGPLTPFSARFGWHDCCTWLLCCRLRQLGFPRPSEEPAVQQAGRGPRHVLGLPERGRTPGREPATPEHPHTLPAARASWSGRARAGRSHRSSRSAGPGHGRSPHTRQEARGDPPCLPAAHRSPSWGQWPRLIGIRCRARHGRSAPHRQTCRQDRHDHTGRCLRARVSAVAERYSSYETRRTDPPSVEHEDGFLPSKLRDAAARQYRTARRIP